MNQFSKALLASAVALACSGPAAAQGSGFVFFGDSLTDAGSYKPVVPAGLGRFTTNPDPVWSQVIGARYGFTITPANQGGTDYAQGGARITGLPGVPPQPPTATAVPVATQVSQYVGHGVDPNAVHAVWGGANDIFFQLGLAQAGQISATEAQANVGLAAQQLVQQVAALQAAGAGNIVVLSLPDIGRTPFGLSGGAAASAQISQITSLYNGTLQAGLNTLGGNVLRVDMTRVFAELLANAAAYGFTNTTSPACGATPSLLCGPSNLVAPDANRTYMFADGVHPTGAASVVIAGVVASLLEGPQTAATLTEGPISVEQATFRAVDARMWSAMDTPYDPQRGRNFWASYDYANPDIEMGSARGDADLNTLSVGGDMRISDHLLAGAAAHFSEYKAAYTGGSHKLEETSATIYAGWGNGPWYAGVSALIGSLDYSGVSRSFDVGIAQRSEWGETSGTHWGVRVHGGYWMKAGGVNHGPFAKLVYQRADIDPYAEDGGAATGLSYGEQRRESIVGSLGWQAQGTFGMVRPFGRVTWEYEFDDDARQVTTHTGLGGSYTTTLPKPDDNWALFHVGAAMDFGAPSATFGKVTGYIMGTATAGKDDGDSYAVTVGVRVPF
jgi:outer membrane lipase/esterase